MEPLSVLLDEVALEGLDGITLPALWARIENRSPPFPGSLDVESRCFFWRALAGEPELQFYCLPRARPSLVLYDRFAFVDSETGIQETTKESTPPEDIYPVHIMLENQDGIQGSCQYFTERVNVTEEIRTETLQSRCSLDEAVSRWGEALVIVASQDLRYRALIGWEGDPDLKLPDYSYCILERLGRARWQGELQRDLHCGIFKVDARKMHYHRRVLDRNGLITLQSYMIRVPSGCQQHSILLLLKRFHVDRRSKYDLLIERVSHILCSRPNHMDVMLTLREQLGLCERTFKRMYQYMLAAGVAKVVSVPLQEINPDGGPCKTKKGTDIIVRCLKLVKDCKKKLDEDDDDDVDDEDDGVVKAVDPVDIVFERDLLTQAYEFVERKGTKGVSQTEIRHSLNVGRLESRMLCRLLVRYGVIKGFMEDEGRQRTTKYFAHVFVEKSALNQQFEREKARSEKLATEELETSVPVTSFIVDDPVSVGEEVALQGDEEEEEEEKNMKTKKKEEKMRANSKSLAKKPLGNAAPLHSTPAKGSRLSQLKRKGVKSRLSLSSMEKVGDSSCITDDASKQDGSLSLDTHSADEEGDSSIIEEVSFKNTREEDLMNQRRKTFHRKVFRVKRPHETCRMLKRKNLILETVRNVRLVENFYTFQKLITEQEKQDGVSTKCCKKSICRLLQKMSQEGLLRIYRTTVIQDSIKKKVEFVVHPSVLPNDPLVKSAIEQVRFRISSSYTAHRLKVCQAQAQAAKEEENAEKENSNSPAGKVPEKAGAEGEASSQRLSLKNIENAAALQLKNFNPVIVPGLGRSLGFLPKMPRLRLTHMFLWHVIYDHPLRKYFKKDESLEGSQGRGDPEMSNLGDQEPEASNQSVGLPDTVTEETTQPSSNCSGTDGISMENRTECWEEPELNQLIFKETVYVDEASWKRYATPTPIHKEYGHGWAMFSDILLCLPLSVFVQIVQISYKVDGLDDYLNDPLKKHTLVKFLPTAIRQQLLYKRRYIFSVLESLQRMCYMGLLQFGPTERFQDKDQMFLYLKRKGTIVDTSTCEPHYNLARSRRPFERRSYTFQTLQDVENFWFDLQFICLNTPLGVVRVPRTKKDDPRQQEAQDKNTDSVAQQETDADKHTLERRCAMIEYTTGSWEVVDNGSIPGDGLGAAGFDSSFFGHLKRNWIWTSYIIKMKKSGSASDGGPKMRLQTFLSKPHLPLPTTGNRLNVLRETVLERKEEEVLIEKESVADRRKRVGGSKNQKRKRAKKENVKKPKKRKKKGKQCCEGGERQLLPDGTVCLFQVKGPFVPWQVVRDIMHARFEDSLDKTSLSVGRRSRYIVKNPQTHLNFKICLAEVYQDKLLVDEFMNRKKSYQDSKVCAEEFKEFVERLREKFSSTLGNPTLEIPDTLQELFHQYKVLAIGDESAQSSREDELKSVDDIHFLVLQNLILSTLALSDTQMKSCQSLQTFRLYREFKDEILVKAFLECQRQCLVTRRRINHILGPKKSRAVPFVPMSYQLSQHYYRLFTWRFPSNLCTESYQYLEKLSAAGDADLPNTFWFPEEEVPDDVEKILFPVDGPGGQCLTSLTLLILGLVSVEVGIPEQIVVVDSSMVDNEVMKSLRKGGPEEDDFEDEEEDDDDLDEPSGSKPKIEVKAHQASHTNYLLMRGYYAPGIISTRNLNPSDNIVVNSCQVKLKLRSTPSQTQLSSTGEERTGCTVMSLLDDVSLGPAYPPDHLSQLVDGNFTLCSLEELCSHCIEHYGYSSEDVAALAEVRTAIEESSQFGIKKVELGKRFASYEEAGGGREKTLKQYIQDLIELKQVLEVGGNTALLVAMSHSQPWLLHSICTRQGEQECAVDLQDPEGASDLAEAPKGKRKRSEKSSDLEETPEPPRKRHSPEGENMAETFLSEENTTGSAGQTGGNVAETFSSEENNINSASHVGGNVAETFSSEQDSTGSMSRTGRNTAEAFPSEEDNAGCAGQTGRNAGETFPSVEDTTGCTGQTGRNAGETFPLEEDTTGCADQTGRNAGETFPSEEDNIGSASQTDGNATETFLSKEGNTGSAGHTGSECTIVEVHSVNQAEPPVSGLAQPFHVMENPSINNSHEQDQICEGGMKGGETGISQDSISGESRIQDAGSLTRENLQPAETDSEECSVPNMAKSEVQLSLERPVEKEVWFVGRPWRIVDGSLNKPVCKGMLEALLYHIMTKPGITKEGIVQYYSNVLQPLTVLELLQALEDLGCIQKRYIQKPPPATLFSTPTAGEEVRNPRLCEAPTAYFEPTLDCTLRLGKVFPNEANWNKWVQYIHS
nr:PREDICTED: general transcription factor 3C polypeptide 1 [Latimeria chalumnae]|eukprot:XP_014348197.1 PREDICTED: general transcription factor 3C polypeptide 1 [Latimeria chalumnae]